MNADDTTVLENEWIFVVSFLRAYKSCTSYFSLILSQNIFSAHDISKFLKINENQTAPIPI